MDQDAAPAAPWEYTGAESLTLTLLKPLKMHETDPNTISEITLTEPTVAQMSAFTIEENRTKDEFAAGAVLIHKNVNKREFTLDLAKKMGSRDFKKALQFLMGFTTPPNLLT